MPLEQVPEFAPCPLRDMVTSAKVRLEHDGCGLVMHQPLGLLVVNNAAGHLLVYDARPGKKLEHL